MKRIALALLFASACAAAQSIALSVSPAQVQPGGTATLTLAFADATPTANLAGIEWTLVLPSGITAGAPVIGAAGTAAAKVLSCGTAICIEIGDGPALNTTAIGSGVLATIPLTVAASIIPGPLPVTLSGVAGTTGPGLAASLTVVAGTLTVPSKYDLNGDGVVNAADVSIMLTEAEGAACAAASAAVGDGKCGLADVELEILAALGVIH